jgi:phosphomannomutase
VSIYKPCGILGDATTELNADLYRQWGLALGMQLAGGAKFVVGGDVRESTPDFLAALVDGLCNAGLDVVELGRLPTPMLHHARRRLHADGCAMVTGSHYPWNINGLRWMIGNRPPALDDVYAMQVAAETGHSKDIARTRTEPRSIDVSFDYVANLQETWVDAMGAQLHIVIDPMHGCWAGKARRYLHAIFPQCLISAVNDAPDPDFDGQSPDCSHPQRLCDLSDAVYRERAHLGITWDGDGDCLAVVDNQGMALSADETAWILLETFGKSLHDERFVCDLRLSDRVGERAKLLGAETILARSGHDLIHKRMIETRAIFGADLGGHYFFRDMAGADDGLYAACRIIAFLAGSDKTLAQWRRECPAMYITPEMSVEMPLESQARILEKIRISWADFPQTTIEGIRIDTPAGWFLVRNSSIDSALFFRFESMEWAALDHLVRRFCDTIGEAGDGLWQNYTLAMGTEGAGTKDEG